MIFAKILGDDFFFKFVFLLSPPPFLVPLIQNEGKNRKKLSSHQCVFLSGAFCNKTRSITVAKDLGYVQHISLNCSDELISICVGNEVWIIEIEVRKPGMVMNKFDQNLLFN